MSGMASVLSSVTTKQANLAQLLVAQTAQVGLLTEDHAQERAADDGDQHLGIERERHATLWRLHGFIIIS